MSAASIRTSKKTSHIPEEPLQHFLRLHRLRRSNKRLFRDNLAKDGGADIMCLLVDIQVFVGLAEIDLYFKSRFKMRIVSVSAIP
jgi:hypothetical protein